jgi:hypothetical protein
MDQPVAKLYPGGGWPYNTTGGMLEGTKPFISLNQGLYNNQGLYIQGPYMNRV